MINNRWGGNVALEVMHVKYDSPVKVKNCKFKISENKWVLILKSNMFGNPTVPYLLAADVLDSDLDH